MKLKFLLVGALCLSGCTTVYEAPANAGGTFSTFSTFPIQHRLYYPHDAAAAVVGTCDQLRLTNPDAHRLCVMRGIDRLQVKPEPLPQGTCQQGIPCGAAIILK